MAHDGSFDADSTCSDPHDLEKDPRIPQHAKLSINVEIPPLSPFEAPRETCFPETMHRPKAQSLAATSTTVPVRTPITSGSRTSLYSAWDAPRRTRSESNMRRAHASADFSPLATPVAPTVAYVASPAHSESALTSQDVSSCPSRPGVGTITPSQSMTLGGHPVAGMVDMAGLRSPRGTMAMVHIVYPTPGPLYVDLYSREDGTGARVKGFRRKRDGTMGDTEASHQVSPGDELVMINGLNVRQMIFSDIIAAAKMATFPLTLTFQCIGMHRDEDERVKSGSNQPSSGSVPLLSPSNSIGWGTRLHQLTRGGSFDQKTSGGALPLEVAPSGPLLESNGGKFGFSLSKVGTEHVKKNLFRIMGTKPGRPEDDVNIVKGWMHDLALKPHKNFTGRRHGKSATTGTGDMLHSTPIVAVTTGGRFVGILDDDRKEFALTWFRKTPVETEIRRIQGVTQCPYFPSVDDVGAILCLQCESLRFPPLKRIVELSSALVLDPVVGDTVEVLLEANAGSFSATLASNEHDSFQLKISAEAVSLVKISETEEEGGVVVKAGYSPFLQVLLDPTDQLRFTLKVQEFGGFLGHRQGDVCDVQQQQTPFQSLSCFFLVAQNRQNRDILTLLIRRLRARVLSGEQEDEAQRDERMLYMDPAFTGVASLPAVEGGMKSDVTSPVGTCGETARSAESPSMTPTKGLEATSVSWTERFRFEKERSFHSDSSARLSDLLGLEPEDTGEFVKEKRVVGKNLAAPLSRPAMASGVEGVGRRSNGLVDDSGFLEGRVAAQEREILMLREKLASVAVCLKAADQEKKQMTASLEVKDNRIELQQRKLRQLEKMPEQCSAYVREMSALRLKLQAEEQRHVECRKECQVLREATKCASETHDRASQTESATGDWDAWPGSIGRRRAEDVEQQLAAQKLRLEELHEAHVKLTTERNMYRAKALELSKDVRKVLAANENRPLDDLVTYLTACRTLETEAAASKAEAKRLADEVLQLKKVVERGETDGGSSKRLGAQVVELQGQVHELQDLVKESRDQVDAVKRINTALALRLHEVDPETRGSIVNGLESEEEEDGEEEDEEEDAELTDGIAAFRRSLVKE